MSGIRLRHLVRFNPGKSEVNHLSSSTEVSFVPMEAVSETGRFNASQIRELGQVYGGYTYFRDGDVLVAKITPCFENGKGALANGCTNGLGFGTTEFHVLRPGAGMDGRYLFYVTQSAPFRGLGTGEMTGAAGQQRVPEDFIKDFRVPHLSTAAQRAIADFLDRKTATIDEVIEQKEELLGLLAEQRAALIERYTTLCTKAKSSLTETGLGVIPRMPEHWSVRPLKYCVLPTGGIQMGPFGGTLKEAVSYKPGPFKVYGQEHTISGDFSRGGRWTSEEWFAVLRQRYELLDGDIVLTRKGSLGNARLIKGLSEPGIIDSDTIRVRLDESGYDPSFVALLLHSAPYVAGQLEASKRGAILSGLNTSTVGNLRLLLPPLDEQREIMAELVERLRSLDEVADSVNTAMAQMVEYRQALITAAVTGKLDIPGAEPSDGA